MQLSVPEIADLKQETEATRRLYGCEEEGKSGFADSCLLARRLAERGVRFVQVYHGGSGRSLDAHGDLVRNHGQVASDYDRRAAALVQDRSDRGMLEDTLVMGVTEFGRTPVSQGSGKHTGRDHHPLGFTYWPAGGGLKAALGCGSSDDLGYEPAENPVSIYDIHATALHLLGLAHEKFTFYQN